MNQAEWVAKTRERAKIMLEAANRVESGEHCSEVVMRNSLDCDWQCGEMPFWNWGDADYTLKPRRILRAWTAKEWGARIGDEFLVLGKKSVLVLAGRNRLYFEDDPAKSTITLCLYVANEMATITQLDGQPCGEFVEEQK